jgi:hypothetical protein
MDRPETHSTSVDGQFLNWYQFLRGSTHPERWTGTCRRLRYLLRSEQQERDHE